MKQLDKSPINNNPLEPYISCEDYTVSNETFSIVKDKTSELLVTSPRPNDEDLGEYYESEDYISHSDAKKSVFDRVYQLVRNYTLKQKIKLINSFDAPQKTILDIGAGTGDFLLACKNNGWNVEGVEPSSKARSIAEEKLAARGIGTYAKRTLQPLGGRKNKGGQRCGEMETACLIGHDAPVNLHEFLTTKSDCIDLKNNYIRTFIESNLTDDTKELDTMPESVKLLNSYLTVIGVEHK